MGARTPTGAGRWTGSTTGSAPRYRAIVSTILGACLACTLVAMGGVLALQSPDWTNPEADFPRNLLTRAWVHWDSSWYAEVARDGYRYTPGQQSSVAFFPLYPSLMGMLHAVGLNRFWAGILITVLCGCGGLLVFNRWAARLRGEAAALAATTLFAVYPFAFYLYGVVYSDAVFLLCAVGAFFALEDDKPWISAALGALATAARPVAPAVVLALLVRSLERRRASGQRIRFIDFVPALAGAGLAAYMGFLWVRFGDPLAFAHVQSAAGWAQPLGWESWFKLDLVHALMRRPVATGTLVSLAHGLFALGALVLAVPTWRLLGTGYATYVLFVIGIPAVSSKDFMGLGRYAIAAFPVFLTLALLLEQRRRLRAVWLVASAVGLALITLAFAADKYVA